MSTASEKAGGDASNISDFVLAKIDGKLLRFQDAGAVPEGSETITLESAREMTKEALGALYADVAHTSPKNFKDKKVAIDSIVYQVAKMPVFDPNAPKVAAAPTELKKKEQKAAAKAAEVIELLCPTELPKVLEGIAPQARELVLIMGELVTETGNEAKFTSSQLAKKLASEGISERLKTRQEPGRIFAYYKGVLIGKGLIRVS